jgi:hypothetical protein
MQLFIQGKEFHVLEVTDYDSVAEVKQLVAEFEELSTEDVALYYQGSPLDEHSSVLSLGINSFSTLQVQVRLLGGLFFLCGLVLFCR